MKILIQNFILVIISSFLCLIAIELFLFINDYSPKYERYKKVLNNVKLTFNDNPEVFFKDKKKKIVFLGDSFTVGEVCAHNNTDFVSLIKKVRQGSGQSIYNFSSLGISPTDFVNIYNFLNKQEIDTLILVLYYNDIFISHQSCVNLSNFNNYDIPYVDRCDQILNTDEDASSNSLLKKIDNFFETKVRTWTLIKESLANIPFFSKFYSRAEWKSFYQDKESDEFLLLMNILSYFQRESEINNFDLFITYFPDVHYLKKDNVLSNDWENFINTAALKSITIYNPWEYFLDRSEGKNLAWSLTDNHPNCEAHKIMFDYVNLNLFQK
jgi:hypothetical protein